MVYLASDKFGNRVIKWVEGYLKSNKFDFVNLIPETEIDTISLQKLIPILTNRVAEKNDNIGILSCGTGVGVSIGANRFKGIRAVLANTKELAEWSRVYDNSNVLCLSGWHATEANVKSVVGAFLSSHFDQDIDRMRMINEFDKWCK